MTRPRHAALALLVACGPQPQPQPVPVPDAPASPPIAPPPAAASAPAPPIAHAPAEAAPADAPATPVAPAADPPLAAPVAPDDSAFKIAAWRDGWLDLHRLGDDVFVSGSGGLAHEARDGRLVHVEYGLSGQAEPWLGFDGWQVHALGGRWPDNAWLVTEYHQSRGSSPPHVHRRDGGVWKQQSNKDGLLYWYYADVVTWHSGQVLGLRAYSFDNELGDFLEDMPKRTRARITAQLAQVHRGFDLLGETPSKTTMTLDPKIQTILATAAAPTGELFVLGQEGTYDDDTHVQRWGLTGADAVAGTTTHLPKKLTCTTLAVRSADEAYLGCRRDTPTRNVAHMLRFDGAAWLDVPAPPPGDAVRRLSIAPTGELYAIVSPPEGARSELWRRDRPDAAWQRIDLPALRFPDVAAPSWFLDLGPDRYTVMKGDPAAAEQLWTLAPDEVLARTADDVWIVAESELQRAETGLDDTFRTVVLRTRAVGEPLAMLADEDLYLETLDWRPAKAWQLPDSCADAAAFVVLRTLPANAPRDQPEPALEAFVRDNPNLLPHVVDIFEVHRRGRRAVGLFVKLPDPPTADALLAALERAAPGERRTLECRRPRARRKFDPQTGRAVDPAAL